MVCRWLCRWLTFGLLAFAPGGTAVAAYEVSIRDNDYDRQVCSGMWAGENTFINVTFNAGSQGELAAVIYEWADVPYLGKDMSPRGELPLKSYICTPLALKDGLCSRSELGRFIIDLPEGKSINDTSFWSARVGFSQDNVLDADPTSLPDDNFADYTLPSGLRAIRTQNGPVLNPSPSGILRYKDPIHYIVRKTGYYCVAIVPIVAIPAPSDTATPPYYGGIYRSTYNGTISFHNIFEGKLPASDYPKLNLYFYLSAAYVLLAGIWAWLCYWNVQDVLPVHYYLAWFINVSLLDTLANWAYNWYLNTHGSGSPSSVYTFLTIITLLNALQTAFSLFLLLVLSLGLSIVHDSLGTKAVLRCWLLAGAHFVFGVLYHALEIGIIKLDKELELYLGSTIRLLLGVPLVLTFGVFLIWILRALTATIARLRVAAKEERDKLSMFLWLCRILLATAVTFVLLSVIAYTAFPSRLSEDYPAHSWKSRWWLQDGGALDLLCLLDLAAIAYLWQPRASGPGIALDAYGYRYRYGRGYADDSDRVHAHEEVEEEDALAAPGGVMLA